jgi:hypothetical protein
MPAPYLYFSAGVFTNIRLILYTCELKSRCRLLGGDCEGGCKPYLPFDIAYRYLGTERVHYHADVACDTVPCHVISAFFEPV